MNKQQSKKIVQDIFYKNLASGLMIYDYEKPWVLVHEVVDVQKVPLPRPLVQEIAKDLIEHYHREIIIIYKELHKILKQHPSSSVKEIEKMAFEKLKSKIRDHKLLKVKLKSLLSPVPHQQRSIQQERRRIMQKYKIPLEPIPHHRQANKKQYQLSGDEQFYDALSQMSNQQPQQRKLTQLQGLRGKLPQTRAGGAVAKPDKKRPRSQSGDAAAMKPPQRKPTGMEGLHKKLFSQIRAGVPLAKPDKKRPRTQSGGAAASQKPDAKLVRQILQRRKRMKSESESDQSDDQDWQ